MQRRQCHNTAIYRGLLHCTTLYCTILYHTIVYSILFDSLHTPLHCHTTPRERSTTRHPSLPFPFTAGSVQRLSSLSTHPWHCQGSIHTPLPSCLRTFQFLIEPCLVAASCSPCARRGNACLGQATCHSFNSRESAEGHFRSSMVCHR